MKMKPLNIVVVGTLASDPYAGMAWMNMQIVVGLLRLGHNVWYFEITRTWPYHPVLQTRVDNSDYAVPYLKSVNILHCAKLVKVKFDNEYSAEENVIEKTDNNRLLTDSNKNYLQPIN